MITFLRKLFIKDYDNITSPVVREKHGLLASLGGIFINLILFAIKLTIGIFSFSYSIIYDAINNLTDLFSCFVTLIGFKISSLPADKRHPYGHERIEYITGMIIAFLIISVGVVLGYNSISSLINGKELPTFTIVTFIVLGISIIFKILLGLFYKGIGNSIQSEAIKASKQDSFNDAICTSGVLIATLVAYFVPNLTWLDGTISLCIALFIFVTGIKSIIETASPLIGSSPDSNLVKSITKDVLTYQGILGVHDLTCHSYGHTKIYVTLHAEVDGYANMIETHNIIDKIEYDINKKYNVELTIHLDPIDTKNEELPILKKKINEILKSIDPLSSIHDLHFSVNDGVKYVVFDILKDSNCPLNDDDLINKMTSQIKENHIDYHLYINIDHKYN